MENAAIVYEWGPHSQLQVFRGRPRAADETYHWDTYASVPPDEDPNVLQVKDFLDAYRHRRPMPITLADGIQAYEMTEAIRQSCCVRREVELPRPLHLAGGAR